MVNFNYVSLKNFGRFKKLYFDFRNRGMVLVEGLNEDNKKSSNSNGSGKSMALVEACSFLLYGKTLRGQKKDDVIMRGEKFCEGEFEIEIQEDKYKIERKRGSDSYLHLFKNGKDITTMDVRVTQEKIDNLLPYNLFSNAVIFSGSTFESFVLASDVDKKEIMSSMFGLFIFDKAKELSAEKSKNIKKQLNEGENKISFLNDDIEKLKERIIHWQNELESLNEKDIEIDKKELSSLKSKEEESKKGIDEAEENMEKLLNQEKEMISLKNKHREKLRNLEYQNDNMNEKLNKILKLKSEGKCPTCGQEVSGEYGKENIKELESSLKKNEKDVTSVKKDMDKIGEAGSQISEKIADKRRNLEKLKTSQFSLRSKISSLQDVVHETDKEISLVKTSLEKSEVDKKNRKKEIVEVEKTLESLQKDFDIYDFWKEGFSARGISNFILELYLPNLNRLTNEYLNYLFDENVSIEFLPFEKLKSGKQRERWSVELKGSLTSYINCSSGERRRVDLAIMLALNTMLRNKLGGTNLLVVDEAFDPLDEKGVESVLWLLEEQIKNVESFFVVTQRHDFGEKFDKKVLIRRKGGISEVV